MLDKLAITDNILQIAHKAYFVEDNGIDGFLATFAIIRFGEFIQKLKVDRTFQPSVKAVFGNSVGQVKGVEQLGLIVLFALQEFLLRYKKSREIAWIICPDPELCNSYHCYVRFFFFPCGLEFNRKF